jgi:hypothetical protein
MCELNVELKNPLCQQFFFQYVYLPAASPNIGTDITISQVWPFFGQWFIVQVRGRVWLMVRYPDHPTKLMYSFAVGVQSIGMGLHHSGVEILGKEYSFASGGGIFDSAPKDAPGAKFRESIELGAFDGGSSELQLAISGEMSHSIRRNLLVSS